ncbi:MAG: flagellar type III secretion system pore protein FliP [Burkholderiaceae bacterium]
MALVSLSFLTLCASPALAAESALSVIAQPGSNGSTTYSVSIETLLLFSALSFLPAVMLLMTSFTRIVIVLSLMRQALGLQSTPPNQVIIGMSLFLSLFVMSPTVETLYEKAYKPYSEQSISFEQAAEQASTSLRQFMLKQTRETDLALFYEMTGKDDQARVDADKVPLRLLVPAFVISELKTAFQIGFLIFIPFLVIDLVVASVLMSMGMMMLSPVLVALPFKLMLFVLADGWHLLVGSMVASFGPQVS